jgi:general secretion pathway protein M
MPVALPFTFNRREKYLVSAGLAGILVFLILQLLVFPHYEKQDRLSQMVRAKQKTLEDIRQLKAEYETLRVRTDWSKSRIDQRDRGFTLFSFLDELAGKAGLKQNITYMKPSTTIQKNNPLKISQVEMKLQAITVDQLVSYLHMVETSANMVTVKRMSVTREGKQEGSISVVLQVETFEA